MEKIWQAYSKHRSPALKEQLIIHYAPLVKYVAGKMQIHTGGNVEYDDLVGYGVFGLIDAIDKFDITKGVKFETYAYFRIKGSMIDHIRNMDWIPRALRHKNKQLERITLDFRESNGRDPTEKEIAEELSMSVEDAAKFRQKADILSLVSLDDILEQSYDYTTSSLVANENETPEAQVELSEKQATLAAAIDKLTPNEKLVITLYYYEDLTLKEISRVLKVTESRVSHIHTKAIGKLGMKLGRQKSDLLGK